MLIQKKLYFGEDFFYILFIFFVKMILLNVVAGIIIDAFGELRDE